MMSWSCYSPTRRGTRRGKAMEESRKKEAEAKVVIEHMNGGPVAG
jgi:hypothetical protein